MPDPMMTIGCITFSNFFNLKIKHKKKRP